jgi:hypothetical protein
MDLVGYIQKHLLEILAVLLAVFIFIHYFYLREHLENTEAPKMIPVVMPAAPIVEAPIQLIVQPAAPVARAAAPVATEQQKQIDTIVAGQTQLTTQDLLPKYDEANAFVKENPVAKLLQEQNFLQAGYHMGINTIVQSNKIPYLDLRSAPPIAKQEVGPFLNSSYEEAMGSKRRHFELS